MKKKKTKTKEKTKVGAYSGLTLDQFTSLDSNEKAR